MSLSTKDIVERVQQERPDDIVEVNLEAQDPWVEVKPESLRAVCEHVMYEPELRFDLLHCLGAVDYLDEKKIQVVYHLDSIRHKHTLVLKVSLDREKPVVASVADLWRTADWHEREAFDLLGVKFEGHPNLKRILCAEDWVGHPLRKDYEWPEMYHGIPCGPYEVEYANIPPEHEVWLAEDDPDHAKS